MVWALVFEPSQKTRKVSVLATGLCCLLENMYRVSSPISLVIFSVFDTEICEIFHQKGGSAYSRGFGIKKNCSIRWFSFFFFQQHESVSRSLNIRVSAYSQERLIGEEIQYIKVTLIHESVNEWRDTRMPLIKRIARYSGKFHENMNAVLVQSHFSSKI